MRTLTEYSVEDILQVLIVFAVESLELDFALLFPERHMLLRVLPVLVVMATSSEKDSESLYKRVKINRLISIFKVLCNSADLQFHIGIKIVHYIFSPLHFLITSWHNWINSFLFLGVEWSSNSCIPWSSSFSCCNFERIVNVLPKILQPNSSSHSSITSWTSTPGSTRISCVKYY